MDTFYQSMVVLAAVAIVLALLADGLKARSWLPTTPLAATLFGIAAGPIALGLLRPEHWQHPHHLLLEIARLSVAMAVTSIALRVPWAFWKRYAGGLALVLTVGMVAMWITSAVLCWWLLPVGFATALLLGAALTPTDPVIAGSITTGRLAQKVVPARVRHALAAESGANDGAAYAFVTLPLMAMLEKGATWEHYAVDGLLRGILLACLAGAAVGLAVGGLQRLAERANLPSAASLPCVVVALALLTLGALQLIGSDGILGVFVAGVAFKAVSAHETERQRRQEERQEQTQEVVDHLFSWPAFVIFGAMLPWVDWESHWTALVVATVAVLLLRRPPWFYFFTRVFVEKKGAADRAFLSWFGPIGMAAIFYCLHARDHHQPQVWTFGSFVIFASVIVHGVTATAGTRWYGRAAGERERQAEDG
ncbi:MAG TPA: cation:proton antiporter [Phycisphaerae bacterium]|nr:cation:proton antiporter [Phycisphaerae bacterium]